VYETLEIENFSAHISDCVCSTLQSVHATSPFDVCLSVLSSDIVCI